MQLLYLQTCLKLAPKSEEDEACHSDDVEERPLQLSCSLSDLLRLCPQAFLKPAPKSEEEEAYLRKMLDDHPQFRLPPQKLAEALTYFRKREVAEGEILIAQVGVLSTCRCCILSRSGRLMWSFETPNWLNPDWREHGVILSRGVFLPQVGRQGPRVSPLSLSPSLCFSLGVTAETLSCIRSGRNTAPCCGSGGGMSADWETVALREQGQVAVPCT